MNRKTFSIGSLILMSAFAVSNADTPPSHYRIANKFHVDGDGGWDCLTSDDSSGRLFISHGTMVQVLDVHTGKLTGTIPDTKGVHAIALARDQNKGFISDGKDSAVTVFNLRSLATLAKVPVTGQNPDVILYDDFSHHVFTFNGKSNNTTVIDAVTDTIAATLALAGKPEFAVADGKGKVYVNLEDKSMVQVLDSKAPKALQTWPIAPGEEPSGLTMDRENNRLFIVCSNKLMVVLDAESGKVVTTLPIGEHVDGVAFDPANKRAYSSNGDGTLTVVQEVGKDEFKVLETVATQKGARTIALDGKTHHVYMPTAEFGPPPEPTADHPKPRPSIKPGTFTILDVETLN